MSISANLVKELREKTGVGMMDCKKALEHSDGNFEKAVVYLREKGMATATKKSDRSTHEGRVFIAVSADQKSGSIVEINCETDFVSNNEAFLVFGQLVAQQVLSQGISDMEQLQKSQFSGQPFATHLSESILKLGENIAVKHIERIQSPGSLGSYVHMNGKIGVLVNFSSSVTEEIGRDIAMHIAAISPLYVSKEAVPESEVAKERDIIKNQSLNEGKPEAVLEKVVAGKLAKFFKDICLIEQPFVKDSDKTVGQILGEKTSVVQFVRYALG